MSMVKLADMKGRLPTTDPQVMAMNLSLNTIGGFESMQRAARLFASSKIVPERYKSDEASCFIALDMAMRMGANPLMVMQNLYDVNGIPAWSAQFLIATFNKSGRFSSLRYEFCGEEDKDDWGCRAYAVELATSEKLVGPLITISMAKKIGWYGRGGSKWQTMPEQMLRYRAAAWFIRVYAPEIAMGLQTAEEAQDATIAMEPGEDGSFEMSMADIAQQPRVTKAEAEFVPEKQAADKQGVVKAASKIKETAQIPSQNTKQGDGTAQCPKVYPEGPKMVDAWDCDQCKDKMGCSERVLA